MGSAGKPSFLLRLQAILLFALVIFTHLFALENRRKLGSLYGPIPYCHAGVDLPPIYFLHNFSLFLFFLLSVFFVDA